MIWRTRFALLLLLVVYQSTQSLGLAYDDHPWMRAETANYYMQCLRDQINASPRITDSMKDEMNIMSDTMTVTIQKMIDQGMMSESKIKIITKTFATAIAEVIVSEASSEDDVPALIYEIRNAIVNSYVQTTGKVDQQSVDEMMKVINILAQDKYMESGKDDGTSAQAAAAGSRYGQGVYGSGGADSYRTAAAGNGYLQRGYVSKSTAGTGTSAAGNGYDLGGYGSNAGIGTGTATAGNGYAQGGYGSDNTGDAGAAEASSRGYGKGGYGSDNAGSARVAATSSGYELGNAGGTGAVATGSGNRQGGYGADIGVKVGASASSTAYGQVGYVTGNRYELGGYGSDNTAIATGVGGAAAGIGSGIGKGVGTGVAVVASKYGLEGYGYNSEADTGAASEGAGFGLGKYGSGGNAGVGVASAGSGYGQRLYGSDFRAQEGEVAVSSVSGLGGYNLRKDAGAADSVAVSGYEQGDYGSGSETDTDSAGTGSAVSVSLASTSSAGVYKPRKYGRGRGSYRRSKKGRNGKRYRAGGKKKQKSRRNRGPKFGRFGTPDLGQRRYDAYGQPIGGYDSDKSAGIEVAAGADSGYGQGGNYQGTWPGIGFAGRASNGYEQGAGSGAEGAAADGHGLGDGSAVAADGGYGGYEEADAGDRMAVPIGYKQGVYGSGPGGFLRKKHGFVDDFAAAIGDEFGQRAANDGYIGEIPDEYELFGAGSPAKSAGAIEIGQDEVSNEESSAIPVAGNEQAEFIEAKTGDKGTDNEYGQGDYVVDVGVEGTAGDEYGQEEYVEDAEVEGTTVSPAKPLVFTQGDGQSEESDNGSAATDENGQGENDGASEAEEEKGEYGQGEYVEDAEVEGTKVSPAKSLVFTQGDGQSEGSDNGSATTDENGQGDNDGASEAEGEGEYGQGDYVLADAGTERTAAGGYRQGGREETSAGSAGATDYGDEQAVYGRPNTEATGKAIALGYGEKRYGGVNSGGAGYLLGEWPSYYGYGQGGYNGESVGTAGASDDEFRQREYDGENAGSAWPSNYGYGQGGYGGVNTRIKGATAGGYPQGGYGGKPFGAVGESYYGYKQRSGYQSPRPGVRSAAAESGAYGMGFGEEEGDTENIAPVPASASVTNYVKRLYSPDAASRIESASSDLANGGTSALPSIISNLYKSVDKSGLKACEVLGQVLIEALTACMHVLISSVIGKIGSLVPRSVADTVSRSLTKAWAPESYSPQ